VTQTCLTSQHCLLQLVATTVIATHRKRSDKLLSWNVDLVSEMYSVVAQETRYGRWIYNHLCV